MIKNKCVQILKASINFLRDIGWSKIFSSDTFLTLKIFFREKNCKNDFLKRFFIQKFLPVIFDV